MSKISELAASKELWRNLTLRELRGKYKRSLLGWGWSLVNPLAMTAIFTLVFSVLLKQDPSSFEGRPSGLRVFALFLLCGLLPWNFLANAMSGGMQSLVANGNLVKKVYFPREVLVAANTGAWFVSLAIEIAVLCIALLVFGNMVLPWLPLVLLLMALQFAFVLGIALVLSVLNVYFRDTQHLVSILTQLWFYGTPIIYPLALVHQHIDGFWLRVYELNPMVQFVMAYRNLVYDLRGPTLGTWLFVIGAAAVSMVVGAIVFRRFEPRLAEEL